MYEPDNNDIRSTMIFAYSCAALRDGLFISVICFNPPAGPTSVIFVDVGTAENQHCNGVDVTSTIKVVDYRC